MRRVESRRTRAATHARFEFDRAWLWRAFLVLAIVAFIVVFARASMLLFGGDKARMDRRERAIDPPSVVQPRTEPATGISPTPGDRLR